MSQSHQRILDSHIHLWPATATSPTDHGWMSPGHFLSKRHGITDYLSIATSPTPAGFIYIETDRYLPSPFPPTSSDEEDEEATTQTLTQWALQPLEEIKFLRRIVEATPAEGDGFGSAQEAEKMKGCVIYAPFHLSPALFSRYMALAEETAGPRLWPRVVGFRYLLQGKGEGGVEKVVEEGAQAEAWVRNLSALRKGGKGGRSFDVGVDVNRDGYAPLEVVGRLISRVRSEEEREGVEKGKGVRFVLNHLAKHPLSPSSPVPTTQWRDSIAAFADDAAVYMKFSGALNEFVPETPSDVPTLVKTLSPFLNHVFDCFGPGRILFGSDWPVCNVGGPRGEEGNWGLWREVVEMWMEEKGLSADEREMIWWRTACEAYAVEL